MARETPVLNGSAMTVLGPVSADELGTVLPHEHILLDTAFLDGPLPDARYPELWGREVTIDILGKLHRDATSCRDNMVLDDPLAAAEELTAFADAGGRTVADATVAGVGRNPLVVRSIARGTGLNIIAGTGFYIARRHPPFVAHMTAGELADLMVQELTRGMDETDACAGMIGEIGTGNPVHPEEEKVLRAGCRAQLSTGAPMQVHVQRPGTELPRVHEILQEEGVPPDRVAILHMDDGVRMALRRRAAEWGYYVSLDCFGVERYLDRVHDVLPRDTQRIAWVVDLIERGHLARILVSQDIWLKMLLKRYGGWGYDHLLVNVLPWMHHLGMTDEQIDRITVANPAEFFAWRTPV
jgi:phosphotriesterase-related protein